MNITLFEGTATQELLRQAAEMDGSSFVEQLASFDVALGMQLKEFPKGSPQFTETLRLQGLVQGLRRLERDSLLGEQTCSPQPIAAAA
jgi:hypothetical protein